MFIIEMLLLLNTEDGQYRIYNTIENWKKFQSQTSMLPKIIFNIFPHPTCPFLQIVRTSYGPSQQKEIPQKMQIWFTFDFPYARNIPIIQMIIMTCWLIETKWWLRNCTPSLWPKSLNIVEKILISNMPTGLQDVC